MTPYFGKDQSKMLGGLAILLMIWHHLFTWHSGNVEIIYAFGDYGQSATFISGAFGNICVQIFAIISGYALFIRPEAYRTWKQRGVRLLKFLLTYWIILALFLLIGFWNDDILPTWPQLAKNMIGLETGPMKDWVNVPFAWYVSFYIAFIFLSPLLISMFKRRSGGGILLDISLLVLICTLVYFFSKLTKIMPEGYFFEIISGFLTAIHPIICVSLGVIAAKYNLFYGLHNILLKKLHALVLIGLIAILMIIKYKFPTLRQNGGTMWSYICTLEVSFLAFFMVSFSLELLDRIKNKYLKKTFLIFGSLSLYLWFLHGLFFTGKNFMQLELYAIGEPVLIFIISLLMLTPVAYIIYLFYSFIFQKKNKYLAKTSLKSMQS